MHKPRVLNLIYLYDWKLKYEYVNIKHDFSNASTKPTWWKYSSDFNSSFIRIAKNFSKIFLKFL